MVDLFKEIDFSDQSGKLLEFIKKASDEISQSLTADQINKPYCDSSFSNLILVMNLPVCNKEKLQSFNNILLAKLFKRLELTDSYESVEYRMNKEKTMFTGNAIFGFKNAESARIAQEKLDNLVIDQKHILKAFLIQDYENIIATEDQFIPPKLITPEQQYDWVVKDFLKDQFIIQEGSRLTLQTFDHLESKPLSPATLASQDSNNVIFSCNGSYLATLHPTGFQLYGGSPLQPLNFHRHREVRNIEFSPDETIILSFNNTVNYAPDSENYIIWSTQSAQRLRVFNAKAFDLWGSFQFSQDSKYLARCSPQDNTVSVFELPSMALTKNKQGKKTSMLVQNIQKIKWVGKKGNILCCACYGGQENLAGNVDQLNTRIMLYEIPSRDKFKNYKNIQWTMTNCTIFPCPAQDWMCLVMNKKIKKKITTVVQVANLRSKEVEISEQFFDNEKITNFAFEPSTRRLAILYEDPDHGQMKTTAVFYYIDKSLTIKEIDRVVKTKAKEILLPPVGPFFALIDQEQNSATLGYIQMGYFKQSAGGKEVCEVFKEFKQNYLSVASWDPSGRLFLTASKHTKTFYLITNCYIFIRWQIFTAYQKLLYKDTQESRLDNIIWRNRPRIDISEEKEQEYEQKFKDLKKIYSEQDDEILKREELMEKRRKQKMKEEFVKFLEAKRNEWNEIRDERRKLRGFDDDNLSDLTLDEAIEKEEIIENNKETS